MRQGYDPENSLRRTLNPQQDDDIVNITRDKDGNEIVISRMERKITWETDPVSGVMTPKTVVEKAYYLDANGNPLGYASNVAKCGFGHYVKADLITQCVHCRQNICSIHAKNAFGRKYCRRKPCSLIARAYQSIWVIYRIIRYCFRKVTGLAADDEGGMFDV